MGKDMDTKRKIILIVSVIIVSLLLVIGSTFAFFGWTSEKQALVDVTVSSGSGACTLVNDNEFKLFPTYSKYHGRKIKLNARQEVAEKAYIVWNMVVNEINGLQDETFKYELINNSTGESYGSGNFANITAEEGSNTITFSNDNEVLGYNVDYDFTLYLWIDGTLGENPIGMSNQIFDFDMNCNITGTDEGTIPKKNILMLVDETPVSTSKFLRSSLTREQIGSVTFVNDATIPDNAIDVSKNEDNTVMIWYGAANSNKLYDVYIGSSNGKVIIEDAEMLFARLANVTSIDLNDANTSYLTNMKTMFYECGKLVSLNVNEIDTSNVTDMFATFYQCSSLVNLNISNWNTSSVIDMSHIFHNCFLMD